MLGLTLAPPPRKRLEVLCIGAHCDDIEIGCGGTLLRLIAGGQVASVRWIVLSGRGAGRQRC